MIRFIDFKSFEFKGLYDFSIESKSYLINLKKQKK